MACNQTTSVSTITIPNYQQDSSIKSNVYRNDNAIQNGTKQDKSSPSAVSQYSEPTTNESDIKDKKKKLSADVLETITKGPNLKPKNSTPRNFGERMESLQMQGKLVSPQEYKAKMQQDTNEKDTASLPSMEKQSPANTSWKSEYSVTNEASKSTGDMFGLSYKQTTNNDAGPHKSPEKSTQEISSDSNSKVKTKFYAPPETRTEQPLTNKIKAGSSSRVPASLAKASSSKMCNVPSKERKEKAKTNDVKLCSCLEATSFDGSHKCSHSSDSSAIHLNMDNVMKFLGEIGK